MADPLRRRPPPPLLASLLADHLDPGYAAAAARRAESASHQDPQAGDRRSGGRRLVWAVLGLLAAGLLLGAAGRSTRDQTPNADRTRGALHTDISHAQDAQQRLAEQASALARQVRSAQAGLGAGGAADQLRSVQVQGAVTAVTGPGLSLVVDGPVSGSGGGVILDRDVQLLVNGLWAAGAEAVAVGGERIGATSSIRQAGGALLVDDRAVSWPVSVQAIGDANLLNVRFVRTEGFARFSGFVSLYGIRFDLTISSTLRLPAGPNAPLRHAVPIPAPIPAPTTAPPTAKTAGPTTGSTR